MKMKHYLYVACMFIAALAFTACSDDDDNSVKLANVTLHFNHRLNCRVTTLQSVFRS